MALKRDMTRFSSLKGHSGCCDQKKLLKEVERGNKEKRRRFLPSSGSRRNKDLHTVSKTGGESWSYILKIEPMTFSDGLKTGCEKKRCHG